MMLHNLLYVSFVLAFCALYPKEAFENGSRRGIWRPLLHFWEEGRK